MNLDTRETRQLTNNNFYDLEPTWSTDGQRIAYLREEAIYADRPIANVFTNTIRLVKVDGTGDRVVLACPYQCEWLTWSPVSERLAFQMQLVKNATNSAKSSPSPEIFLVNLDGSGLTQLTRGNSASSQPQWSPDGKQIVFLRSDAKPIRIVDVDSQIETAYGVKGLGGVSDPSWSPDQSKIVFSASPAGRGIAQLYVLRLADGAISPLFSRTLNTSDFLYTGRDGRQMALN